MRRFTLGQLVTRCQQRADMENQSLVNDTTGSSEWKFYISSAYSELYSEVVNSGMRHFEKVDAITTDGTGTYTIPDDLLSVIGVDYIWDTTNGKRRQLSRLMVQERNRYKGRGGASEAVAYALVGDGNGKPLELHPTPPTAQSYELVYIPHAADLTTAADTTLVDVVAPAGEEFLLWAAAVLAKAKEQDDVTLAIMERERHRARLQEWAQLRAFADPNRIITAGEIEEDDEYGWRGRYW